MRELIELAIILPVLIILYQLYRFSLRHTGVTRQKTCLLLGTVYCTLGITSLAIHTLFFVIGGLLLILFGLRLFAHGLDRIDKQVFIDRYDEKK